MTRPRRTRSPLPIAVIAAATAVAVAGVVAAYAAGWLPLAGPFVAVLVAPLLGLTGVRWRHRRFRRASASTLERLREVQAALRHECAVDPDERASGATMRSLTKAEEDVERALRRFAWGHEQGALPHLRALAVRAQSWAPASPLARAVAAFEAEAARLAGTTRALERAAGRRRAPAPAARDGGGSVPPPSLPGRSPADDRHRAVTPPRLTDLAASLRAERALPPDRRGTGASDAALDGAAARVERASALLADGSGERALERLAEVSWQVTDSWQWRSPLSMEVLTCVEDLRRELA